MKTLDPSNTSSDLVADLMHEVAVAVHVGAHAHVVTLFGACFDGATKFLLCEFMECGSLESKVVLATWKSVPWNCVLGYLRDTAAGLLFLASKRVVHRDVRCANILIDGAGHAKVCDFGLAHQKKSAERPETGSMASFAPIDRAPWKWMAPEQISDRTCAQEPFSAVRRFHVWGNCH
jgi:serine/threonine protein kinase